MASNRGWEASAAKGPTLDDCNRLWTTIKGELVSDAEIHIQLQLYPVRESRPVVIVHSPGFDPKTGAEQRKVWATKELGAASLAITYAQLYDLLIVAHRRMENVLGGVEPF